MCKILDSKLVANFSGGENPVFVPEKAPDRKKSGRNKKSYIWCNADSIQTSDN